MGSGGGGGDGGNSCGNKKNFNMIKILHHHSLNRRNISKFKSQNENSIGNINPQFISLKLIRASLYARRTATRKPTTDEKKKTITTDEQIERKIDLRL